MGRTGPFVTLGSAASVILFCECFGRAFFATLRHVCAILRRRFWEESIYQLRGGAGAGARLDAIEGEGKMFLGVT